MVTAAATYRMLGNETLWDAARAVHAALEAAGTPHAILGGVAVCLHGYRRNTVDVDLVIRGSDAEAVKSALLAAGFDWDIERKEFRSPAGVIIQFVYAGDRAGAGSEVLLPDPLEAASVTLVEDLPVLTLARLIESKIACGQGTMRRTHRDFADVIELIAAHDLSRSFARYLHKSVRQSFRELVLRARGG